VVHHHYSGFRSGVSVGFYWGYPWPYYYGYCGCGGHASVSLGYVHRSSCANPYIPSYARYGWSFCYPDPITVAYVPYGFYCDRPAVYVVQRTVYVTETEYLNDPEPAPDEFPLEDPDPAAGIPLEGEDGKVAEGDGPPMLDATTERFLRDGSTAFAEADYETASENFRFAVIASPDAAAPKFAFGQALFALRDYAYASRVLRDALHAEPTILGAPGSIAGVYRDGEEFERVMKNLEEARRADPTNADLLFLTLYQLYFTGDPRARGAFDMLAAAHPDDTIIPFFKTPVATRFAAAEEYPPSEKTSEDPTPSEKKE
jgi:hypothetical protein